MGRMAWITALFLLMTLVAIQPGIHAVATDPPLVGDPNVFIDFDQDSQTVSVQPGSTGVVRFTGVVTVDYIWLATVQYILVSLMYNAGGWVAVGTDQLTFSQGINTLPFECIVKAPEMSDAGIYEVEAMGSWRMTPGVQGGTCTPATAAIEVLPYSKLAIGADQNYMNAKVGEECTFDLRVIIEGNCGDNVTLTYDAPDGVEVSAPSSMACEARSENGFQVKVTQRSGAPRVNAITIRATGSHEGNGSSQDYTLRLKTHLSASSFSGALIIVPIILLVGIGAGAYLIFRLRRKRKASVR